MSTRIFTGAELEQLARPFRLLLADAMGDRDLASAEAAALAVLDDALAAYGIGTSGFHSWAASILSWLHDEHGPESIAPFAAATASAMAWRQRVPPTRRDTADGVRTAISRGDVSAALDAFGSVEAEERYLHDVALDWVCVLLSEVYRRYGDDGLEATLRRTGDETLLAWMPRDIAKSPKVRLVQWTRLLKGNFASLSVREDEEKFTITQDPCGSCGRQLAECAYPGPLDLALVSDAPNLTRHGRPTTVYRTHAVLMHQVVPLDRLGVPWPVVECPDGTVAGPCTILLYKRPDDPAALDRLEGTFDEQVS